MNNVKYTIYIGETDKSKPFIDSLVDELTIQCGGTTLINGHGTYKDENDPITYRDNTIILETIAPYWMETRILEIINECEVDCPSGELCIAFTKQEINFELIYL